MQDLDDNVVPYEIAENPWRVPEESDLNVICRLLSLDMMKLGRFEPLRMSSL